MNLTELRWRAEELIGADLSQEQTDPGELDRLLNETYLHVCGLHHDWPFLFTSQQVALVAGTQTYTLAPAMKGVRTAFVASDDLREALERRRRHDLEPEDWQAPGRPRAYALEGFESLYVWPEPDAAYTLTLRGAQVPSELTEAAEPIFASEFHPIVAYGAAAMFLAQLGDQRSVAMRDEVGMYLDRMRRDYLAEHDDGLIKMGGQPDRIRRATTYRGWQELS